MQRDENITIFVPVLDKLKSLLSSIRYRDAFIFQIPSMAAMAIFFPGLSSISGLKALLLVVGSFLLMAYIFVFNDWADFHSDRQVSQNSKDTLPDNKEITQREMLILSVFLALVGGFIVAIVSTAHLSIVLLIIIFGLVYSFPICGLQGKSIPIFSSFLHFAGILLTFLLGSMTFGPIGMRAILVGAYFGIIISAGHLVQEVQGYSGDRLTNIRTNAVRFGQKLVFIFSFIIFGFSFVFLYWLAQIGFIPGLVKYTMLFYPIYAFWAFKVYRSGLDSESVKGLRERYRVLFAIIVFVIVVGALAERDGL